MRTQIVMWGAALNPNTVVLAPATVMFAFWVRTGEPFFVEDEVRDVSKPRFAGQNGSVMQ